MEVQQLVGIARRGGAQEGQEGRQERRAAARAQVRAAGVSAEASGIYVSFPGCQASASWCTWGRTSSWRPAGDCWTPLSFYAASGAAARAVPKRTKSSAMVKVCAAVMAAQSARPGALNMPGSGALAAAAGPKGKGSGGAMQGRPLRCQHGRRWSQSARARWCCISWRSGGRLAVPGPKSDRAAPSWRGWVAQKSAAHHAMVPMQLNKHCHSRDLAERWRLAYCIILWPLYSLHNGKRPVPDQKTITY